MEKPELLKKVLAEYCAQSEELKFHEAIISAFCEFAAGWFQREGIIGVGHTTDGLSLRLANGDEYILFSQPDNRSNNGYVAVTGNASKIEKPANDFTRSFNITGR